MRILWSSNAIWAHTGYGVQAKYLLPRFRALGHEVAQFAWYGLQGAKVQMGDILIYPCGYNAWGNDIIGAHAAHFRADVVISLMDIWVLPPNYRELVGRPWVCWFPVDHYPCPDAILERAKTADYPVTYSKFGQRAMRERGLDCHYIPHGVDTEVFRPGDQAEARRALKVPEDCGFLAVMVAANKGVPSRKAFPENLWAFAQFARKRKDLNPYVYLHTEIGTALGGVDIMKLAEALGIQGRVLCVDQYLYRLGLPPEYLAQVYQAADVLLAASCNEGFGIPIIEAQACGCPVITTDWTSMPELTVNGISVTPAQLAWTPMNSWVAVPSVVGIYEALLAIADRTEEEKRSLAAKGRETIEREYSWDVCIERYWKPFLEQVEADLAGKGSLSGQGG